MNVSVKSIDLSSEENKQIIGLFKLECPSYTTVDDLINWILKTYPNHKGVIKFIRLDRVNHPDQIDTVIYKQGFLGKEYLDDIQRKFGSAYVAKANAIHWGEGIKSFDFEICTP